MSRRSFLGLMFGVMFVLCAVKWTATADVIDNRIFRRNEQGASFDLTTSKGALELTITPQVTGNYEYSFSRLTGNTERIEDTSKDFYVYAEGKEITAKFSYATPADGGIIHYVVRASFVPRFREKTEDINKYKTDENSCGMNPAPYAEHEDVTKVYFLDAGFTASADVSNVNSVIYVNIEKE